MATRVNDSWLMRELPVLPVLVGATVVAGGLGFWWLGLPSPNLSGAVMAILVTLPLYRAALIWIPAAVSLAFPVHAGGSWCILWKMMSGAPTANGVWVTEPTRVTSVGAT